MAPCSFELRDPLHPGMDQMSSIELAIEVYSGTPSLFILLVLNEHYERICHVDIPSKLEFPFDGEATRRRDARVVGNPDTIRGPGYFRVAPLRNYFPQTDLRGLLRCNVEKCRTVMQC